MSLNKQLYTFVSILQVILNYVHRHGLTIAHLVSYDCFFCYVCVRVCVSVFVCVCMCACACVCASVYVFEGINTNSCKMKD